MIQWWRSTEDIYAYASSTDHQHREAWLEFYRRAKAAPKALTIWHETYAVAPGGAESVYATDAPTGSAPWPAWSRSGGAARPPASGSAALAS